MSEDHALLRAFGSDTVAARAPMCGILSGVVAKELNNAGISTEVRIRDLDILNSRQKLHVIAVATMEGRSIIIDQAYSQFFSEFGLHYLQLRTQEDPCNLYPSELYVSFDTSEARQAADWAAQAVRCYWRTYGHCTSMQKVYQYQADDDGWDAPTRLVKQYSQQFVSDYFAELWDLSRYRPHAFSEEMQQCIGRIASAAS